VHGLTSRPLFTIATYYISGKKSKTAVLYLTDVFGIQLPENKLYALDPNFARRLIDWLID
jgi:hypothetical protein